MLRYGVQTIVPEENIHRLALHFGLGLVLLLRLGGESSSGVIVLKHLDTNPCFILKSVDI